MRGSIPQNPLIRIWIWGMPHFWAEPNTILFVTSHDIRITCFCTTTFAGWILCFGHTQVQYSLVPAISFCFCMFLLVEIPILASQIAHFGRVNSRCSARVSRVWTGSGGGSAQSWVMSELLQNWLNNEAPSHCQVIFFGRFSGEDIGKQYLLRTSWRHVKV